MMPHPNESVFPLLSTYQRDPLSKLSVANKAARLPAVSTCGWKYALGIFIFRQNRKEWPIICE